MKISGFVTAMLAMALWTTTTLAENSYLRPSRHATAVDGNGDYDKIKSSNHEHALSNLVSSHGGNFYARLEVFPVQDCAGEGGAVAELVAGGKRRHYSTSVAKAFVGAFNQDNNDYKITSYTVTREEDDEEEDEGPFVKESFLPEDLSKEDEQKSGEAPSVPLASSGSAGRKKKNKGRKQWVKGSYHCRLCGRKPVMTAAAAEGGQQNAAADAAVDALKGTGEYLEILNDMCKKVIKRGGCEYRSVKRCKASWTYRPYGSFSEREQELDVEMILTKDYWYDEVVMQV